MTLNPSEPCPGSVMEPVWSRRDGRERDRQTERQKEGEGDRQREGEGDRERRGETEAEGGRGQACGAGPPWTGARSLGTT